MASFSYVILHYKNIHDTLECILSIPKHSNIIVVDNATLSKEEEKQIKKYTKDLLKLDKNYGFAKANNKGISYAREKYKSDFIVVLNNDIILTQKDFEQRIEEIYQKTFFDLLGPKIITNNGDSVNPFPVLKTMEEVEKERKKVKRNICLFRSKVKSQLFFFYHNLKYKIKKLPHLENGKKEEEGIALHGCAIIFSKKYLEKYEYAFYNETFLYHEEEFLYHRVKKDHLISYYSPTITCFHKEGGSLNYQYNENTREKELFRNEERLKSLDLLYEEMKKSRK